MPPASTPTDEVPGLGRGLGPRHARGLGGRGSTGELRRLRAARPATGSTTSTSSPAAQRQGIGSVLLDLVKAQRPAGFCLWVFEMQRARPGVLPPPRPGRARAHRRRRQRGEGARRPDGVAGRRPAGVLPPADRRGRPRARRAPRPPRRAHRRRPAAQARPPSATWTASARSPRRWPCAPRPWVRNGSTGSCTRSSPRASTPGDLAERREVPTEPRDCRRCLPPSAPTRSLG